MCADFNQYWRKCGRGRRTVKKRKNSDKLSVHFPLNPSNEIFVIASTLGAKDVHTDTYAIAYSLDMRYISKLKISHHRNSSLCSEVLTDFIYFSISLNFSSCTQALRFSLVLLGAKINWVTYKVIVICTQFWFLATLQHIAYIYYGLFSGSH